VKVSNSSGIAVEADCSGGRRRPMRHASVEEVRTVLAWIAKPMGITRKRLAEAMRCDERTVYLDANRSLPDLGPEWNRLIFGEDDDREED
jgi:hypothetical protein